MLLIPSFKGFTRGHTQDPRSVSECSVRACLKDELHVQGVCVNQRHLLCPAASWGQCWRQEAESQLCELCEEGERWGSSTDPHEQTSGARALL